MSAGSGLSYSVRFVRARLQPHSRFRSTTAWAIPLSRWGLLHCFGNDPVQSAGNRAGDDELRFYRDRAGPVHVSTMARRSPKPRKTNKQFYGDAVHARRFQPTPGTGRRPIGRSPWDDQLFGRAGSEPSATTLSGPRPNSVADPLPVVLAGRPNFRVGTTTRAPVAPKRPGCARCGSPARFVVRLRGHGAPSSPTSVTSR